LFFKKEQPAASPGGRGEVKALFGYGNHQFYFLQFSGSVSTMCRERPSVVVTSIQNPDRLFFL
jgi:hypothetical protein